MRKQYSKSDIKQFLEDNPFFASIMNKKSNVVIDDNQLFVDGRLCFISFDGVWAPTLRLLLEDVTLLPQLVVDKGAIKFVVNGADVMRPGIVRMGEFSSGAIVVIVDEGFGKPLAVGRALYSSQELGELRSGKVVAMLHHIGDEYWNNNQ